MKALLIFPILTDLNQADGILVKNEGIYTGFLENGVETDKLEFTSQGVFCGEEKLFAFSSSRYRRIWQYHTSVWKAILDFALSTNYDLIWFRLPMVQPFIASFIKQVKRTKPDCRIILEYGAYPYVNELAGIKKMLYRINTKFERQTHNLADRVITYSGQYEVDGLPNIPINNGIDLKNIPVVTTCLKADDVIHFISVSSIKKWHAYDRFIRGMADYLSQPGAALIHFHVVGEGPEHQKLIELVSQYRLDKNVSFHGFKTGAALDDVYQQAHAAIGTLGFHRIGLTNSSSLKNREYFARGLPVVLSTLDQDMPAELSYVHYIPGDESPVAIHEIIRFVQGVQRPNLHAEIREYAEQHLSWKSKIAEVLEHLHGQTTKPALQKI